MKIKKPTKLDIAWIVMFTCIIALIILHVVQIIEMYEN